MSCFWTFTSFPQANRFIPSSLRSSLMPLMVSCQPVKVQPLIVFCSPALSQKASQRASRLLLPYITQITTASTNALCSCKTFSAAASLPLRRPFAPLADTFASLRCLETARMGKFNSVCTT